MSTGATDQHPGHEAGAPPLGLTRGDTDQVSDLPSVGALLVAAESSNSGQPLLTVIVPVYNERATVDRLLQSVLNAPYSKQIVVVDDGSSDGSSEALQNWQQTGQIELLTHAQNKGKGAAIRTGLTHARGQLTIIQDADLEYDPQDYQRLIQPLLDGQAQVVYGSRRLNCRQTWRQAFCPYYHCVTMLNICVRLVYGTRITDEATCYKVFPTSLLRSMNLTCQRFEFCPEVTAKACRLRLRILEVPIHYTRRGECDGKKIGVRDAIEAFRSLWRFRNWQPEVDARDGAGCLPVRMCGAVAADWLARCALHPGVERQARGPDKCVT